MREYIIRKILNNNIVQCYELGEDKECILLGKGIGFQKQVNDLVNLEKVEKEYYIRNEKNISRYQKLVEQCDDQLVLVIEEVIAMMEERFGNTYDEYLHIALLDHINFSIYRYKNNIEVKNIFLDEYSVMYASEYAFAKEVLAYINERLQITLPDSEIGFITLHVHSALHEEDVSKSALYMKVISHCIEMIESRLPFTLDSQSIEKTRLVTHLKFALERAGQNIVLENVVLDSLKDSYPNTYALANDIANEVQKEFDIHLPEGEVGYITLHLQNIIMTAENKKKGGEVYVRKN